MSDYQQIIHFSDVTLLFEHRIIFKNQKFEYIYELKLLTILGLKTCFIYFGTFVSRTIAGLFKDTLTFKTSILPFG
jgi:hypothetical protein